MFERMNEVIKLAPIDIRIHTFNRARSMQRAFLFRQILFRYGLTWTSDKTHRQGMIIRLANAQ